MAITVNGPGGVLINFPDDVTPDTIHEVMGHATGNASEPQPKVGMLETVGRAAADTGTFGLANGALDRKRLDAGRQQNPWSAFAGDALGVLGQGVALAAAPEVAVPAAYGATAARAGQVANATVRGAQAALLPNLEANTAGALARTGAKVGGMQGALHGAGDTATNPDKQLSDIPGAMATEGAIGAATGAVLAPAIHATVRGANGLYHRLLPGADQAAADFGNPAGAATSQIQRAMDYDGVTPAQMDARINVVPPPGSQIGANEARAIADQLAQGAAPADVAQATGHDIGHIGHIARQDADIRAQYDHLNALEAVKSGPVRPSTRLPQDVPVVAPSGLDQDTAHVVADRLASGESPAQVAQRMRAQNVTRAHVDDIANQPDALATRDRIVNPQNVVARQTIEMRPEVRTATNLERVAKDAARMDGPGADVARDAFLTRKDNMGQNLADSLENVMGATDRTGDATAQTARKAAASEAYNQAADRAPSFNIPTFGGLERDPLFGKALQASAIEDFRPGEGLHRWQAADGTAATDGQQGMGARQLIRINSFLDKAMRNATDPAEAYHAQRVKQYFQGFTDTLFADHPDLRGSWSHLMRLDEATEAGSKLPAAGGGRNHDSMAFLERAQQNVAETERAVRQETARYNAANTRFQAGAIRNAPSRATLNAALEQTQQSASVLREFQAAFGENMAEAIHRAPNGNPTPILNQLLTSEGKARLINILGRENATQAINYLYNMKLQTQLGNSLYGGSDTAYNAARMSRANSAMNAGGSLVHGRFGDAAQHLVDAVSQQRIEARNNATNTLMSRQGVDDTRQVFGGLLQQRQQQQQIDPISRNPALTYAVPMAGTEARHDLQQPVDPAFAHAQQMKQVGATVEQMVRDGRLLPAR